MIKKILIFTFIILLSFQLNSLSLLGAQDISKSYISDGEFVDTFTQSKISCEDNDYFVIPIINSLGEPVLFVPISVSSSKSYLSKTDSFNIKLVKTGYLVKILKTSDSGNFLSIQIIDSFDSQINSLNSKRAQLNGILQKNYSSEVNLEATNTINNINILISYLEELKENTSFLLTTQNSFISNPDCDDTLSLINLFTTSFKRYNEISQASLTYIQSSEKLVTKMVAENNIPAQELPGMINVASPPQGLNSSINLIFERLSSTSAFYTKISNDFKGSSGDLKIKIYVDNFYLRQDFVTYKNHLERYDPSFPNYNNLESVVKTIINPEYKDLWEKQEDVLAVQKIYDDILDLSSKAQYSKATDMIPSLKNKSLTVMDAGFKEQEEEVNWFYYISIAVIVILLIVFLIIIKRKPKNKNIKFKQKVKKKSNDGLLKFDDPF